MEGVKEKQGQLVFGLDIGTRSIVGTVGYLNGGKFHVLAQRSKEHETRAMLDGQIHDIGKVGETISQVKEQKEKEIAMPKHNHSLWKEDVEMSGITSLYQYEFMRNAILSILIITPLFGILGTMIVNNKMAFFSDALGHSALTGIAVGVVSGIPETNLTMVIFEIVFALLLIWI